MLILAPMAVFTTLERVRLCTVLGIVIAALSPVVRTIDFSRLPAFLTAYFVPSYAGFPFFPWAAFLAFGMAMGSVIRLAKPENLERVMGWTLGVGVGLTMAAYQLANLPYSVYSKPDFWLDSPALTAFKLGLVLCILSVAYLWMKTGVVRWSLMPPAGHDFPLGLLGSYRACLWSLVRLLQGEAGRAAGGPLHNPSNWPDDRTLGFAHSPAFLAVAFSIAHPGRSRESVGRLTFASGKVLG